MKSPQILLVASALFLAYATAQQPARGAESTHATRLTQVVPQNEKKPPGHKHGHRAKKDKSANNPQAKGHGMPGSAAHKAAQKPAKPAVKQAKPQAKPAAAARKKPHHAHRRAGKKRPGKNGHRKSENRQRHGNGKPAAAAQATQKKSPAATRTEHKKTGQAKPAHRKPQQPKESAKPARPTTKQVEQHKGAQPLTAPARKTAEQPSHRAPKAARPSSTEKPSAEQTETPPAGRTDTKNAKQAKPEQRQPSRTKEGAKAAQPSKQQAEQPKGAQPSSTPAAKSAAQKPANPPEAANAPPPPTKPRSASSFILRKGEKPAQGLDAVRRSRRETREGNRLVIREGDRTIEREDNRAIIRHSASGRFAVGARHVDIKHQRDRTVTVVVRPNGVRIISTTDRQGHLIRRVRRGPHGREIVIIDDSRFVPRRRDELFVDIPPPRMRHRRRHILEADRADRGRIYEFLTARPIERLRRRYTVEQVRYNHPLREYMPRVDLDIHFETGSWQLTPDQIDRLGEIAAALNEAIDRNPREVYLIEGFTDAVGSWEDNLSLSDRRAESVAVALTEQFHVPPENLVTQGYGEEHLKIQTQGPSRANRRVAVQRITPLIAKADGRERR